MDNQPQGWDWGEIGRQVGGGVAAAATVLISGWVAFQSRFKGSPTLPSPPGSPGLPPGPPMLPPSLGGPLAQDSDAVAERLERMVGMMTTQTDNLWDQIRQQDAELQRMRGRLGTQDEELQRARSRIGEQDGVIQGLYAEQSRLRRLLMQHNIEY